MSTLYDICLQGQKVSKYTPVKLPTGEAHIFGFVAYHDNVFSDNVSCPPLGKAYVVCNRIVFSMENKLYRFPIFSSIEKNTKESYPVYLLYVPRLMDLPYQSHVTAYVDSMKNEKPNSYVWKVDSIRLIEGKAYYFPQEDEFYFDSTSQFKGIGDAFEVIITRKSPVDGSLIYEVYDPKEIEIIEQ